jgi:hypothetical protein
MWAYDNVKDNGITADAYAVAVRTMEEYRDIVEDDAPWDEYEITHAGDQDL